MQTKPLLVIAITLSLVLSAVFLLPGESNPISAGRSAPTSAPTATPGVPVVVESPKNLLAQPLSKEGAIVRAIEIDQQLAVWKTPWTQETLSSQPERVKIEWYSDRNYDGNEYGPEAERGPVWVIEIKGAVRLNWDDERFHEGITYRIAEKTGNLLSYTLGPWSE